MPRSSSFFLPALLFALSLSWLPSHAQAASLGWQPSRTWVFVGSLLEFKEEEMFSSFPKENRRDDKIVQFFRKRGVPNSHITYCKDQKATLKNLQNSLVALLQKTAPGDTLFFYYQGHGFQGRAFFKSNVCFAAYDTDEKVSGWPVHSIPATIDRYFKGNRAILTADCCYSGALASAVQRNRGRVSYAAFTSSSSREPSTGNWTFSDCLLDALNGEPFVDSNRNGVITAAELAHHALEEMTLAEEQQASFAVSGRFSPDLVLAKAEPQPLAPIGQRVKAKQNGEWYVARIVAVDGREWWVDYVGYDEPDETFLATDKTKIQVIKPRPTFPVGAKVEVKWQGDWFAAKILKVNGGVHFIHYIEDDASWDEWVTARRIRAARY